jgi:hypothetical protein
MTTPLLAQATDFGRLYRSPLSADGDTVNVRAAVEAGLLVPSVTNVIGVLHKPYLMTWYAKRAAEEAVAVSQSHPGLMGQRPRKAIEYLKTAAERTSAAAAALGDEVHQACEDLSRGSEPHVSAAAAPYVKAWRAFVQDFAPEFLHVEATCFGKTPDGLGYAGTADFIARINGRVVVGDYKTGKAVHTEASLQLAALAHAEQITTDDQTDLTTMPVVDGGVVLHLTPSGYRLFPVDVHGPAWAHFTRLRAIWDFHQENLTSRAPLFVGGAVIHPEALTFPAQPARPTSVKRRTSKKGS